MTAIKLDARLSLVASFVRPGSILADIGTDHAYLPAYLVGQGVCPSALACDVRKGPLQNAQETICRCNLQQQIQTVLSDGLDALEKGSADDVVLAGMGGVLIAQLLSRASWLRDPAVRIIAQPMSHGEDVRRFLFENGFVIDEEAAASDGKRIYIAMAAHYTGKHTAFSPAMPFLGRLTTCEDPAAKAFLDRQFQRLQKQFRALAAADGREKDAGALREILYDYQQIRRMKDDNRI